MNNIPFTRPYLDELERKAVDDMLASGGEMGGNGPIGKEVEQSLSTFLNQEYCLLCTSCTHALEIAIRLMELAPGDEVICPAYSFPSVANAILLSGARVVFADIDPVTLNISAAEISKHLTSRSRGVITVHYAGVPCDMDPILQLASDHGLFVVEDAAQALGSKYKETMAGIIGDIGCFSFHSTKNIACGEGGAIVTGNRQHFVNAEIIREKGTNRSRFLAGEIDRYSWVGLGSSYVLSDILAAILRVQLGKLEEIQCKRAALFNEYINGLTELQNKGKLRICNIPDYARSNHHIFYFLIESMERDKFLLKMKEKGIVATSHFVPLHCSVMGRRLGYSKGDFSSSEEASSKIVRLPLYPDLTNADCQRVIESCNDILTRC